MKTEGLLDELVKMEKENSLCCGYNLGNTQLELSDQMKIRNATIDNLTTPKPDVIITACPMCKRALQHGNNYPIEDISELVCKQLKQ